MKNIFLEEYLNIIFENKLNSIFTKSIYFDKETIDTSGFKEIDDAENFKKICEESKSLDDFINKFKTVFNDNSFEKDDKDEDDKKSKINIKIASK